MALRFELHDIDGYESVCYDEDGDMCTVTSALIFLTMHVGIGEITPDNADEFYARVSLYEKLFGPLIRVPAGDRPIVVADVLAHQGLVTNVAFESRAKWQKRIVSGYLDDQAAFLASDVASRVLDKELAR